VPFYTSPSLLAPRLSDFSPEAGFPRVGYATTVDAYVDRPVTSGSWRRGVFDWLTLESHAEAGGGLINGGAGAVVRTGTFGVASLAMAGSHWAASNGLQPYAASETQVGAISLNASSQMTFGSYEDLASMSGRFQNGVQRTSMLFGLLQYDIAFAGATICSPLSLSRHYAALWWSL
jgi:outer membrane usher protein